MFNKEAYQRWLIHKEYEKEVIEPIYNKLYELIEEIAKSAYVTTIYPRKEDGSFYTMEEMETIYSHFDKEK